MSQTLDLSRVSEFLVQENQVQSYQAQIDHHNVLLEQCAAYLTGACLMPAVYCLLCTFYCPLSMFVRPPSPLRCGAAPVV